MQPIYVQQPPTWQEMFGQGLGRGIQQAIPYYLQKRESNLVQQDMQALQQYQQQLQGMQNLPPAMTTQTPYGPLSPIGPAPLAPSIPPMKSQAMRQMMAQQQMANLFPQPISPYQRASLEIEQMKASRTGLGTPKEIEYWDAQGNKHQALVLPENYNTAIDMIERQGGSLVDPGMMKYRPEIITAANNLRKEFMGSSAYKDFQTVQRSEQGMRAAYEMSISPDTKSRIASDQALAVLFQKMLDPTSVVRESEYARTPEGIAALNKLQAFIPQLAKGGLEITHEDRKALYDMAQKLLNNAKGSLNKEIKQYTDIAKKQGLPVDLVLGNIKPYEIGEGPIIPKDTTMSNVNPNDVTKMNFQQLEALEKTARFPLKSENLQVKQTVQAQPVTSQPKAVTKNDVMGYLRKMLVGTRDKIDRLPVDKKRKIYEKLKGYTFAEWNKLNPGMKDKLVQEWIDAD